MTDPLPAATDLPDALVATPQWVCWREESRDDKPTKVPVEPGAGAYASVTDPDTWRSFDAARAHAAETDCGLGFVFTAVDRFVGVDLDDCRDPEAGQLTEQAREIVDRLDSYTEVSPSGTGVHVLVVGDLPDGRNRHGTVEMYDDARFFTVTGDCLSEAPTTVARRPDALAAIHEEYVQPETAAEPEESPGPATDTRPRTAKFVDHDGNDLADDELLTKAKAAANGSKFARLYRGSTAGYPSQSEADMALCTLLAFWTGGDATQIDRLFRDSGLMREKWDEVHFTDGATYGERTIERAIAATDEVYDGDGGAWTVFDGDQSRTQARPNSNESSVDCATDSTAVDGTVDDLKPRVALRELRDQLATLEAENERLRAEIAAEQLPEDTAEPGKDDTHGWLSRLQFRFD